MCALCNALLCLFAKLAHRIVKFNNNVSTVVNTTVSTEGESVTSKKKVLGIISEF